MKKIILVLAIMMGAVFSGFVFDMMNGKNVYACEWVGNGCFGEGAAGTGVTTSCGGYVNGYTNLCGANGEEHGDGAGGGGVQWRAFRRSSLGSDGMPKYAASVMDSDRTGNMVNDMQQFDYYFARGWVGKDGILRGPIATNEGMAARAAYNNYNAGDVKAVLDAIRTGKLPENGYAIKDSAIAGVLEALGNMYGSIASGKEGYFGLTKAMLKALYKNMLGIDIDPDAPPTPETDDNPCTAWAPASYGASSATHATTSVVTKIRNPELNGTYSGWHGNVGDGGVGSTAVIYAMPTDTVTWQSCYFPGIQVAADSYAGQDVHGEHGVAENTPDSEFYTACQAKMNKHSETCTKNNGWDNGYDFNHEGLDSGYGKAVSSHKPHTDSEYEPGDSAIKDAGANAQTFPQKGSVGQWSRQQIFSGSPVVFTQGEESHRWGIWTIDGCTRSYSCNCSAEGGCETCTKSYDCTIYYGHANSDKYYTSKFVDGPARSTAEVRVPYNYTNEPTIAVGEKEVYSGDTIQVTQASVNVKEKANAATERTYTTEVHNAVVRIYAYVSDSGSGETVEGDGAGYNWCTDGEGNAQGQCYQETWGENILNPEGDLHGFEQTFGWAKDWNAFDAEAGKYMCFRLSVYPSASGEDTNMDPDGNRKTLVSAPACKQIAKTPVFHIYGGSLFTNGSIDVSTMEKNNVYDIKGGTNGEPFIDEKTGGKFWGNDEIYKYETDSQAHKTFFGSWAEQSVIANQGVRFFASGASMGFNKEEKIKSGIRQNAGMATGFCKERIPLSMANVGTATGCPTAAITGFANIPSYTNRKELVDYWSGNKATSTSSGAIDARTSGELLPSTTGRVIRRITGSGNLELNGFDVYTQETFIIRSDNSDITINGDIKYSEDEMRSGGDVPKVVIYAQNINIKCNVHQLDAILIAEGVINTCSNASQDVNSVERSNQLKLRGMVIANTMKLPRTYGTASGYWSGLAAEEIDYDTSALLWGRYMAGSGESGTLTTVYQSELPTRY